MDNPYSYCVVERSTGKVLVCESSTVVAVGAKPYPVLELRNIKKDSNEIQAEVLIKSEDAIPRLPVLLTISCLHSPLLSQRYCRFK
jgi:hypothetical protein